MGESSSSATANVNIWYQVEGRAATQVKNFSGEYVDDLANAIVGHSKLDCGPDLLTFHFKNSKDPNSNEELLTDDLLGMLKMNFQNFIGTYGVNRTNPIIIRLRETPKTGTSDMVYVFIDNSNILIEGMYTIGKLERLGKFDVNRQQMCFKDLQIDHGVLLSTVLSGRPLGPDPVIVGSRPPANDTLWDKCRKNRFEVKVYNRNAENKEKKVDTELAVTFTTFSFTKTPGVMALVAGDGDYVPAVKQALDNNWKVEVWFWYSGMSNDLTSITTFKPLDNCYRLFSFTNSYCNFNDIDHLKVTDGEALNVLTSSDILKMYNAIDAFAWWRWNKTGDVLYLLFPSKKHLEDAEKWITKNWNQLENNCDSVYGK